MAIQDRLAERITESLNRIWVTTLQSLRSSILKNQEIRYCPLFLQDVPEDMPPAEIDSCATSIGVLLFSKMSPKKHVDENLRGDIKKITETLVLMQNPDGSWPSIIPLSSSHVVEAEGVVNDTLFALHALLEANTTIYSVPSEVIYDAAKWLLDNRVQEGWDYVGVKYALEPLASPKVAPTCNSLRLLQRTKQTLAGDSSFQPIASRIDSAYSVGMEWLGNVSDEGGYGKKYGESATVAHTALALGALLTDSDSVAQASNALRWLLENPRVWELDTLPPAEIFEEYNQILVVREKDRTTPRRRTITHEHFVEGLLLQSLVEAVRLNLTHELGWNQRRKFKRLILRSVETILGRQEQSGPLTGAFRGRRSAPSQKFPVYALSDAMLALDELLVQYKAVFG